jgi:hypothetical protein
MASNSRLFVASKLACGSSTVTASRKDRTVLASWQYETNSFKVNHTVMENVLKAIGGITIQDVEVMGTLNATFVWHITFTSKIAAEMCCSTESVAHREEPF